MYIRQQVGNQTTMRLRVVFVVATNVAVGFHVIFFMIIAVVELIFSAIDAFASRGDALLIICLHVIKLL